MEFKPQILVVDDEFQVQELITTLLRHEGYLVETANNGQQALARLAENSFDLVITDLMMPDVSGLDVLAETKTRWPATEVVLMTAHGALNSVVEALRHGAYDYLTKPFSSQELLHSIRRTLAYHHLKLEKEELLADLQRQVYSRNTLVKAAERIATVLDHSEVIRTVLEATFNILPDVELAIVGYKTAEAKLGVGGLNSQRAEVSTFPLDEALILKVMDEKRTHYYPDWTPPQLNRDNLEKIGDKSLIIEPLIQANSSLGVLAVTSQRVAAFDEDYRQLLKMLATQAAIAMKNAQLYAEARRIDELEALHEAGQAINQTLDLQETLATTLAITRSLTGATIGHVYLYASEQHRLGSVITLGEELTLTDADRRQAAEIALHLLTSYHADNSVSEQKVTVVQVQTTGFAANGAEKCSIQSWLAVPLIRASNLPVGVLELGSTKMDAFTVDDVRLVQVIAAQATTAIENARLYEELSFAYRDQATHQAEILRSHKTLQALFDGITDGLYIIDQEMRIVAINQAEARRLGLPPESLIGQPCEAALWGEATPAMIRLVMTTFETGHEGNWESQVDASHRGLFIDRDIRTYPIFLPPAPPSSLSPEAEKRGVGQVIIFAQDVSEKRQLQASLFRSANLATVGRLASSIAHQINNPLTVIIANGQLMELEMEPGSPDYPVIRDVVEAGIEIRQIVQNLLDFSTQDSYDWFETNIQKTLEDGLALVAHPLRKSQIEVITQIAELSPIIASASHLKLVWMNLLLNARDAIVEQGRQGIVKIEARQTPAGIIQVQIVDNGTGLPPEHQANLFRPFFSTKAPGQGLGLGLYTCRTIIEYHHGQIELKNNPDDCGVTVTVTLPLLPTAAN